MSYVTSAPTFAASEVVTATKLNALADGIQAAWTAYTPTWTGASTNPVLGNGSFTGSAWLQVGKRIDFRIVLTAGSTTTYGTGAWSFTLPTAAKTGFLQASLGNAGLFDTSASAYRVGHIELATVSTVRILVMNPVAYVDVSNPWTWANTDKCILSGTYEAA